MFFKYKDGELNEVEFTGDNNFYNSGDVFESYFKKRKKNLNVSSTFSKKTWKNTIFFPPEIIKNGASTTTNLDIFLAKNMVEKNDIMNLVDSFTDTFEYNNKLLSIGLSKLSDLEFVEYLDDTTIHYRLGVMLSIYEENEGVKSAKEF